MKCWRGWRITKRKRKRSKGGSARRNLGVIAMKEAAADIATAEAATVQTVVSKVAARAAAATVTAIPVTVTAVDVIAVELNVQPGGQARARPARRCTCMCGTLSPASRP